MITAWKRTFSSSLTDGSKLGFLLNSWRCAVSWHLEGRSKKALGWVLGLKLPPISSISAIQKASRVTTQGITRGDWQEHVWRSYVISEILNTKYIARKGIMTEKKFIANHTTKNGHNFLNSSVQYFLKHFLNPSVQYCVAASLMKPFRLSPLDRKPFNLVENGAEF